MGPLVRTEPSFPGITAVTIHRSAQRNALSIELVGQLCEAIESLAKQSDQRVMILRGDGPVFSAGLDLREAMDDSLIERSAAGVKRVLGLLKETPLVTIAAVQGGAYAGGAGLMAACDIAIAADDAKIGFPEARRGLLPALISNVLRHRLHEGDLRYLLLTGDIVPAAEALRLGLVERVVPAGQLLPEAHRVAELILAGGPDTIRRTKQLINGLYAGADETHHARMEEIHLAARRSDEAREGLTAFREKRDPWWIVNRFQK